MTKIDPTPLIAEAQARDTALQVALDRIERMESKLAFWRWYVGSFAVVYVALDWWLA